MPSSQGGEISHYSGAQRVHDSRVAGKELTA